MKTLFFETHFHLRPEIDFEAYKQEAFEVGVGYLMAVGSDLETSSQAERFSENSNNYFFSAGVHPHEAQLYVNEVDKFNHFLSNDSCRAVGEIGLDYFYENSDRDSQMRMFEKFLALSLTSGLPAIVHCRDSEHSSQAYEDAESLLVPFAAAGGRFVVHCFTGTIEWAERFLEMGAYIGITGIVTFPKADNVRKVAAIIPDDRLLLETDAPYLAPVPFRGKSNHSKYIPIVAEHVAKVRGVGIAEIATQSTHNAFRLFDIDELLE